VSLKDPFGLANPGGCTFYNSGAAFARRPPAFPDPELLRTSHIRRSAAKKSACLFSPGSGFAVSFQQTRLPGVLQPPKTIRRPFLEALDMTSRRHFLLLLVAVFPALGASYRTTNFVVSAPTPQIAQQFAEAAEYYRKEKALHWLGREMPAWGVPCPLFVKVTMGGPGGATTFQFDRGQILSQRMEIEGPLDRLLASVLPHEVTHTVFAYYFRQPVPRWADEGGSVLSEDDAERLRHDRLVRRNLNEGRAFPLRRLFELRDYPRNNEQVGCMYAEGFSMTNYLVNASDRPTFLKFLDHGMHQGWDSAVRTYYHHNSVEELEAAWLAELRRTRGQPDAVLAKNTGPAPITPTGRTIVRLTAPPVQPLDDSPRQPTYRGLAPSPGQGNDRFGDSARRPEYLPEYNPAANARRPQAASATGWQPVRQEGYPPVQVQLGPPQFEAPPPEVGMPVPGSASPVGYPQ
jgi:hypothetical protein